MVIKKHFVNKSSSELHFPVSARNSEIENWSKGMFVFLPIDVALVDSLRRKIKFLNKIWLKNIQKNSILNIQLF